MYSSKEIRVGSIGSNGPKKLVPTGSAAISLPPFSGGELFYFSPKNKKNDPTDPTLGFSRIIF